MSHHKHPNKDVRNLGDIKEDEKEIEVSSTGLSSNENLVKKQKSSKRKEKKGKQSDPNFMYYSQYITEHDTKRIIYGLHRLLHNYVMFRCEDPIVTAGIISERFIEKLSLGFDKFLKNAYFYDLYYQPISFKRRYGYVEIHIKIGVEDLYANKHRMFKKVFLVIFHRGAVKFILTKYKHPARMLENEFKYAVRDKECKDVWCRVDFVTAIVNKKIRRVSHKTIETLYDILISEHKTFHKMNDKLEMNTLWTCIDFDADTEDWSKTEKKQFIKMLRQESNPYNEENLKHVASLETRLEKEKKSRKRKPVLNKKNS